MKRTMIFLFLGLAALLWGETVINGSRSILGTWNAGGATATIPAKVGTTAPATCTVGEQFFDSDATAGSNLLLCTATNTWSAVSGGGGGGGGDAACMPGDLRYVCWADDFFTGLSTSGMIGAMGWQSWGSGSTAARAGEWPNVGLHRLTTGTASGNISGISLAGAGGLGNWFANGVRESEVKFVFRLNSASDSNFRMAVGALNVSTGGVQNGFGVGKGGNNNFHLFVGVGGEQGTTADFGVAVDNAWHTLRFYTDPTVNQRAYVTLDGTTTRTACPSGCDLTTSGAFALADYNIGAVVITNTNAARTLDVDYISLKATVGTNAAKRN
jgi:hypothetical protein